MIAPAANELIPLSEVARRMGLSGKTLKRMRRKEGMPLFPLTKGGGLYAFWSEIQTWASKRQQADAEVR